MKTIVLIATVLSFMNCQALAAGQIKPYETDLSDPLVVFAVKGINDYRESIGDNELRKAEKIVSATSQLVAGTLYRFKIEVSGGPMKEVCHVNVLVQEWLNSTTIQGNPLCAPEPIGRRQVGEPQVVDLSDKDTLNAFKYLERNVTITQKSVAYLAGIEVGGITKQIVNGELFKFINVKFARTICHVNATVDSDYQECVASAIGEPVLLTCTSSVFWNPRQTPAYSITSQACNNSF